VVQVTKALQENSEALVLVTEPIFCSLANLLRDYKNVGRISDELTSYALEPLEVRALSLLPPYSSTLNPY
jgi:SCY1-like protein 2